MDVNKITKDLKNYIEIGERFKEATATFLDQYENLTVGEVKELQKNEEFMKLIERLDIILDDLDIQ